METLQNKYGLKTHGFGHVFGRARDTGIVWKALIRNKEYI